MTVWEMFGRVFSALGFILSYIPYWGPPVLLLAFWRAWLKYVRAQFIASQSYTLLEIRLPQEVRKTPQAMQNVLDGIHMTGGESTFIKRIWEGSVRPWYSLELVSIEGKVHFYLWCRQPNARLIERTFYAYYPDVEVIEVTDYATRFPFSLETHDIWGANYKLSKNDAIPIKTYIDYQLDKSITKEEEKVDPITGLLEFLGSMGKGEHLWIQILIRAHKREDMTYGTMRNETTLEDRARREISRIRNNPEQDIILATGDRAKVLSDDQLDVIKSINRSVYGTNHYDTGIRVLYVADKDRFDGTTISGSISAFKQFGAPKYNVITPDYSKFAALHADYPWEDYKGIRENKAKLRVLDAYRRRSWFHAPYHYPHFVLTTEELATIYHLPGTVAQTPSLDRIPSIRVEAPSNLPI